MSKEPKEKKEEDELVGLTDDKKDKKDYNEQALDVIKIIEKSKDEDQFKEYVEFLGSFLELGISKFGDETILNHMENIKFNYRLTRRLYELGILKEKK